MVAASDVRTAAQVVLVGEVFRLKVRLRTRHPGASANWALIGTADVLAKLEAAGKKAIDSKLSGSYRVTVEHEPESALLYRVTSYGRLEPRTWWIAGSLPGAGLESQVLSALGDLTARVEDIASDETGVPLAANGKWEPGPGLSIVAGIGTGGPKEVEARIQEVLRRRRGLRVVSLFTGVAGALLLAAALGLGLAAEDWFSSLMLLIYAVPLIFIGFVSWTAMAGTGEELTDLRDQQDLVQLLDEPLEQRAQKLFQVHSHQLKRYYDQALRQRAVIFSVGLACIFAGFGIVVAAFWFITHGTSDLSEQIVVATLGAVGGILANFIAVVYLRMFTQTVKSIGGFHDRLVLTHHLHFANFLAAKVSEQGLRDQTLAHMAKTMAIIEPEQFQADAAQTDGQATL